MKSFLASRPRVQSPGSDRAESASGGWQQLTCDQASSSGGSAHEGSAGGAQVETVREGDKIVRLRVTCSCGEVIEIDCLYGAGAE